jgi:hypothetical protein
VVGAGLHASPIDLRSPSEQSDFPSVGALISSDLASTNTTGKVVDNEDPDTDPEEQLFVAEGPAQTPPSTQPESRKRQERHDPASPEQRVTTRRRRSNRINKKSV